MVQEIVNYFGSQTELARKLGLHRSYICRWVAQNKVPALWAIKIESLTRGKFKATEIMGLKNE